MRYLGNKLPPRNFKVELLSKVFKYANDSGGLVVVHLKRNKVYADVFTVICYISYFGSVFIQIHKLRHTNSGVQFFKKRVKF